MKNKSLIIWSFRLIPSIILLQTLYFKFSASPESVYIFKMLGLEPYGRILIGILELIAGVLVLLPRVSWIGAFLGIGLMCGAISSHILKLGIIVMGDGGKLFIMANIVLLCCLILIWFQRKEIPYIKSHFVSRTK